MQNGWMQCVTSQLQMQAQLIGPWVDPSLSVPNHQMHHAEPACVFRTAGSNKMCTAASDAMQHTSTADVDAQRNGSWPPCRTCDSAAPQYLMRCRYSHAALTQPSMWLHRACITSARSMQLSTRWLACISRLLTPLTMPLQFRQQSWYACRTGSEAPQTGGVTQWVSSAPWLQECTSTMPATQHGRPHPGRPR